MEMSDASTIGRETLRFYRLWLFIGLGLVFIWTWTGVNCPVVQAVVMGPDPTQRVENCDRQNCDRQNCGRQNCDRTTVVYRVYSGLILSGDRVVA